MLAYAHIDGLLRAYLPTLERMTARADDIDEQTLEHPDESALAALMYLKRSSPPAGARASFGALRRPVVSMAGKDERR